MVRPNTWIRSLSLDEGKVVELKAMGFLQVERLSVETHGGIQVTYADHGMEEFRHDQAFLDCCYAVRMAVWVAVETAVICRPPHRSVHAELPHSAPGSGMRRKAILKVRICLLDLGR